MFLMIEDIIFPLLTLNVLSSSEHFLSEEDCENLNPDLSFWVPNCGWKHD